MSSCCRVVTIYVQWRWSTSQRVPCPSHQLRLLSAGHVVALVVMIWRPIITRRHCLPLGLHGVAVTTVAAASAEQKVHTRLYVVISHWIVQPTTDPRRELLVSAQRDRAVRLYIRTHAFNGRVNPCRLILPLNSSLKLSWMRNYSSSFHSRVSWSLTSLFSTNMAISETKGQGWKVICTQWRKASDILTSTLATFLFSSHPKKGKGSRGSFKLLR